MATTRELREDREARECLEAEQADEAYMGELRHQYPKRVKEERRQYELYKTGAVTVIDLCSIDDDEYEDGEGARAGQSGGGDGDGEGGDPGPMTESD